MSLLKQGMIYNIGMKRENVMKFFRGELHNFFNQGSVLFLKTFIIMPHLLPIVVSFSCSIPLILLFKKGGPYGPLKTGDDL